MMATRGNFISVVRLILSREPNINTVDQVCGLFFQKLTTSCSSPLPHMILNFLITLNSIDFVISPILQNGLSPLAIAAREGYVEIASMLIELGAYVNAVDRVQLNFFEI